MLTDGIEQILFCAPCAARSLPLLRRLGGGLRAVPSPPPPSSHRLGIPPRPGFGGAPALHPACSAPKRPRRIRCVLRPAFPSWQHRRGCPALPEQLLREGEQPQTVNYSSAPLRTHTHPGAVEILCVYTHTHKGTWRLGVWRHGGVRPCLSLAVALS